MSDIRTICIVVCFISSVSSSLAAPIAEFSANSTFPCINQSITFSDLSSGTITTYSWDFGSGANIPTANTIGPHSVFYSTGGLKTVSLTVTGPNGSNTITKINYINVASLAPSLAGIISGSTSVCLNASNLAYSISPVANAASYSWTVPVGASITSGQGSSSIISTFGSTEGNVCVNASNGCGTGNQICQAVDIAKEQIVFMNWNLLNYPAQSNIVVDTTTRHPHYRTILGYANPDIFVAQEVTGQNGVDFFLSNVLNVNSNTYTAGTFINGFDTDNAIFFKSSKFIFISNTPITTDLRDITEFKLKHILSGDTLRIYSVHLKASSTAPDEVQRALEVDTLRKYTNLLPTGSNFIVCGDFNFYRSTETAYQKLLTVTPGVDGHFIDPITMTGTWNNVAYAPYHTQSSRIRAFGGGSTGGLNDRFDLILFSNAMMQSGGISYVSGSTFSLGNDGNHYNDSINKQPNTAVSVPIADALHNAADHIPVICHLEFQNSSCPVADLGVSGLLTPSNNICSSPSQSIQVVINNYGTSSVNFGVNNLQVNVAISDPSSSIQNLTATVNSGSLSPGATTTVTFSGTANMSLAGNYTINAQTVFFGDIANSNDAMAPVVVNVFQNTLASISAGGPTSFCAGRSVLLSADQTSGVTYQWIKDGSTIAGANAQNYTATQSGSYQVQLQTSNTILCDPVVSSPIIVTANPLPIITYTPAVAVICSNSGVTLTASGANTYSWSPSTGLNTTSGAAVFANPLTQTAYTVTGTDLNSCSASATITLSINTPPVVAFSPLNSVCITSLPFALSGGSPIGGVYSGAGVASGIFNPSSAGLGTHTITYLYTDVNGCNAVATQTISVIGFTAPAINPAGPIILCQGASVNLTTSGGYNYLWSTGATTQSINISNAGNYSVVVSDNSGCSATSSAILVSTSTLGFMNSVFTETMGTVTGTTVMATHESNNGFDNDAFTMTGTADVRTTTNSFGYAGASGGANVFITNVANRNFIISGINTSALTNIQLSFGIAKSSTAGTGSDLLVQYSTNGTTYTTLPYAALPTGSGTATWYLRSATGLPSSPTLSLQFIQTGTATQYRIDDVSLSSQNPIPGISVSGNTNICQGNSVVLTADLAASYLWDNGATLQSISVSNSSTHVCMLTASNGCTALSSSVTIIENLASNWYIDSDQDGYGNASVFISDCSQPIGYVSDNTDCNDGNAFVNPGATEICGNNIDDNCNGQIDEGCSVVFNIKVFIEGYYQSASLQTSPLNSLTLCDTIFIKLASSVSPYSILYSTTTFISTTGNIVASFPSVILSGSFYLVIDHRNSLETWSTLPISINQNPMTYDFTNTSNKAFGNNQKSNGDGTFSILSGDVNKDGQINFADYQLLESELNSFVNLYNVYDLTGDNCVESADFSLIENNINGAFIVRKP